MSITYSDHTATGGVVAVSPDTPLPIAVTGGLNGIAGAVTVADSADVAQGAKADAAYASGSGSVIAILKGIFARLVKGQGHMAASLSVAIADDQTGVPVTVIDGGSVAVGTTTDASSASTVIGLLKNLKAALAGTLAVSDVAVSAIAVAKSDATVIAATRGLWVGGTGDVTLDTATQTNVLFAAVPAGTLLRISAVKVKAATTATNIVALA